MTFRLWPRSLAARTALVLIVGLVVVQVAGLGIHALDRIDVQRLAEAREIAVRVVSVYRAVFMTPIDRRGALLEEMRHSPGLTAQLSQTAPSPELEEEPLFAQRLLRVNLNLVPLLGVPHWRGLRILPDHAHNQLTVSMRLPDGDWLNVVVPIEPPRPWHSPTFLAAFLLMTLAAAGLTLWAVRRLTAPVRTLAEAAEALGRDVNAPPLPENGPTEVATAAAAFNTMAARIRRFVQDRTELLTAIGHDLRTPITRLKLRCEFVEDDEQRGKMLADLEELEAMVSATLAFGRDAQSAEPVSPLDLAELLRTILDETGDAWPDKADTPALRGSDPLHDPGTLSGDEACAREPGGERRRLRRQRPISTPPTGRPDPDDRTRGRRPRHSTGRTGACLRAVPSRRTVAQPRDRRCRSGTADSPQHLPSAWRRRRAGKPADRGFAGNRDVAHVIGRAHERHPPLFTAQSPSARGHPDSAKCHHTTLPLPLREGGRGRGPRKMARIRSPLPHPWDFGPATTVGRTSMRRDFRSR